MKMFGIIFAIITTLPIPSSALSTPTAADIESKSEPGKDYGQEACYFEPLPDIPASTDNRTIPWGSPTIIDGNTTCCSSLDEVRAGIDEIGQQLLSLLSKRAAYVREATRFKATRDTVDVPSRDLEVIQGAIANAPQFHLPQVIAEEVFTAIINASVKFELCAFDSFDAGEN